MKNILLVNILCCFISFSHSASSASETSVDKDVQNQPISAVAAAETTLEAQSSALDSEHEVFVARLKTKQEKLAELQSDLSKVDTSVGATSSRLEDGYSKVSDIWENTVDQLLEVFSEMELQSTVEAPELLPQPTDSEDDQQAYGSYVANYKKFGSHKSQLVEERTKLLNDLKVKNFKLLQDAGTLRAKFLHACDQVGCDRPRGLNEKNVGILLREIRVVPLRFIAGGLSKWTEIKSKFASGLDGWIDLVRQIFILFILVVIPFFLMRILSWTSNKLDAIKKDLISKSMLDYRRRTGFAVWISRLNPFVPSVGMIISISFASSLIRDTDFKELAIFLYYFQIYYIYRAVRLLLTICLEIIFSTGSIDTVKQQKLRIKRSATKISRLVFIEFILLHITEDTVRRALAYQMFSDVIFWVNIIFIISEAGKWRNEIC
ncbi:MAG: hypothetical protein KDD37_08750, partial [Bdellovibrionales bacterium]|nr:hypothetical protein [Bdellovibrionales bacterium]